MGERSKLPSSVPVIQTSCSDDRLTDEFAAALGDTVTVVALRPRWELTSGRAVAVPSYLGFADTFIDREFECTFDVSCPTGHGANVRWAYFRSKMRLGPRWWKIVLRALLRFRKPDTWIHEVWRVVRRNGGNVIDLISPRNEVWEGAYARSVDD